MNILKGVIGTVWGTIGCVGIIAAHVTANTGSSGYITSFILLVGGTILLFLPPLKTEEKEEKV